MVLKIKSYRRSRHIVEFSIDTEGKTRFFLHGRKAFLTYASVEISEVPDSIVNVPIIGVLYPLAMTLGDEIVVDELDLDFYFSLVKLKKIISIFYPHLPVSKSNLTVFNIVKNNVKPNGFCILFSGGVDSTALLLNSLDGRPCLVTIWGADIPLHDIYRWRKLTDYIINLSKKLELDYYFIAFYNPIDVTRLDAFFRHKMYGNDWWGGVAAGITTPSLTAPTLFALRKDLRMSPGLPKHLLYPWSDTSLIVDNIRVAGLSVVSGDENLSRIDKVRVIAEKEKELKIRGVDLMIRSCFKEGTLWNCGYCEKCARTITGLYLCNLDPNALGFQVGDLSKYFRLLKLHILTRSKKLEGKHVYTTSFIRAHSWNELKHLSKRDDPLVNFLQYVDFEASEYRITYLDILKRLLILTPKGYHDSITRAIARIIRLISIQHSRAGSQSNYYFRF
jgi:hypothetical protein